MSTRPFTTVLVANRGEIACRVIGTLRRLGIRSVAVYSDADDGARHVQEADVAVRLGPAPAAPGLPRLGGYLDVDAVVAAAVATGADAIHPGYGFLSENPALARACERAGIVFVGPSVAALETMADKAAAKRLVASHDVPVLPGTHEDGLDDAALVAAAHEVGFPLLVKPVAGGGGKGMVVVPAAHELPAALASARRVAASSFGDDGLLLERLVERPRHIEVQVLADAHAGVVHLGERECTLQRRHQKVVEEAPSPVVDAATRARLGEAACAVARSVGYVGAGTVEFLAPGDDPGTFWFIEMNTRLQVEHPVTEMVTGLDLVEQQLRVAAGEPLAVRQEDVRLTGHAVEARLYAESPARGFLPAAGRVLAYDDAGAGAGPAATPLRLDSGLLPGAEVTGDYDPMLAKAVAWAPTRAEAIDRLDGLLADVVVLGVETNAGFLRDLLADDDVRAGRLDTSLIDRFVARSLEEPAPAVEPVETQVAVAAAVLALVSGTAGASGPWAAADGFRLNAPAAPRRAVLAHVTGAEHRVAVTGTPDDAVVTVDDGEPVRASARPLGDDRYLLTVDGTTRSLVGAVSGRLAHDTPTDGAEAPLTSSPAVVWVHVDGRTTSFTVLDRAALAAHRRAARALTGDGAAGGATRAPVRVAMPGTVSAVPVADGDVVAAGQPVVVVEAMKMEHPLLAPVGGVVRLDVRAGDQVRLDQVVAVVDPDGAPANPAPAPADPAVAAAPTQADPATRGAS
ncbi:ATP-binding protein [Krasilnikoviella flava]|uniref:biotin carboxylase n=1 Tax=Krasilnikoviella flava TaxID=526729 RepID=A0A1T5J4B7_9MICO|nr:biotin carboxylase N-terminal domain-containing protein [Krasilnikoviella flava]SKC46181.1 acetyl-CoA/propionyl-CoA carboxylase, biotin carboxylase, biotin carboxyl carrier protein [Krasilnikoviella flava]